MSDDTPSPLNNVITIDDERIKSRGGFAPTTRFSASCARSAGAPASWARFLTVNRRSTSPPRGCATSPARRGLRRGISISSCFRTSRWEVPSPREPGPGASQPNRKCERFWTLPIVIVCMIGSLQS
jgi:hypothetical protein